MPSILRRPGRTLGRHLATRSRGQSLVEFALILPLFLVFVAACLDLGRVFYANISLNNAAREGAMQAASKTGTFIQDGPCDPVNNTVVCRVQFESKGSQVAIASTDIKRTCSIALPTPCARAAGSTATVTVRGTFRLVTPLLSAVFGGQSINLTSSATAQIEYLPQIATSSAPPAPTADFTWSPTTPAAGDTITFDASSSTGNPTGWQWDFDGDGVADSTAQNPTHVYPYGGSYTVTLLVVNLTGVANRQHTVIVSGPAVPSSAPSTAPSGTACTYPPNVFGQSPGTAQDNLRNAGFTYVVYADLTTGPKNKIQAQNPDHTQCLAAGTQITIHYRPG
ncbi:MAG: TadE/TadG family type IV pilus assembly protein [Candidatus Limnocylindrales bacterium]